MLRAGLLCLCLAFAALVAKPAVHAFEQAPDLILDCAGQLHGTDDADDTKSDSDRNAPHHHPSCHEGSQVSRRAHLHLHGRSKRIRLKPRGDDASVERSACYSGGENRDRQDREGRQTFHGRANAGGWPRADRYFVRATARRRRPLPVTRTSRAEKKLESPT